MELDNSQAEAEYFGLAETWDEELYGKLKRDRLIAFVVAAVAALISVMAIIAVMMLTPLKTETPFLVLVDQTTGQSEIVRKLNYSANPLTEKESFVLSEIHQYVLTRHTYDPLDSSRRLVTMQMTTSGSEIKTYHREFAADRKKMNASERRFVNIKSVVPNLRAKTAQVRFSTTIETSGGKGATRHWIATLKYNFVDLNMPMKYRHLNPLGFIVTSYRVDPETLQ